MDNNDQNNTQHSSRLQNVLAVFLSFFGTFSKKCFPTNENDEAEKSFLEKEKVNCRIFNFSHYKSSPSMISLSNNTKESNIASVDGKSATPPPPPPTPLSGISDSNGNISSTGLKSFPPHQLEKLLETVAQDQNKRSSSDIVQQANETDNNTKDNESKSSIMRFSFRCLLNDDFPEIEKVESSITDESFSNIEKENSLTDDSDFIKVGGHKSAESLSYQSS